MKSTYYAELNRKKAQLLVENNSELDSLYGRANAYIKKEEWNNALGPTNIILSGRPRSASKIQWLAIRQIYA